MPTTHHRPYDAASLVRLPLNLEPQSLLLYPLPNCPN